MTRLDASKPGGKDAAGWDLAGASVSITYGTATAAGAGGEAVTVRGRPGRLQTADTPPGAQLTLDLDLGRGTWLTINTVNVPTSQFTREEILAIAESVQIPAEPDLGWLGT